MNQIKIFSPASVSNLCCGFDVLGFSIDGIGDELTITKSTNKGINIKEIKGYNVPLQNNKNTRLKMLHDIFGQGLFMILSDILKMLIVSIVMINMN